MRSAYFLLVAVICLHSWPVQAKGRERKLPREQKAEATSATTEKSYSMFVGCGVLFIENHGKTNFTVLLKSEEVQQLPDKTAGIWVVDDVLLEVVTTDAESIGASGVRGKSLLEKHMNWEVAYTSQQRRWPQITPNGDVVDMGLSGVTTMMWGYDAPSAFELFGQSITRVLYLTAAVEDIVFVISAPMRTSDDPRLVARVMGRGIRTLQRTQGPVNVSNLAAEVKAGRRPWKGCNASSANPSK